MPIPNVNSYIDKNGKVLWKYCFEGKPKKPNFEKGDLIPKRNRIRRKGFRSEKEAKTAAMEHVQKEFNEDKPENMTVKELFDRYINNCIANGEKDNSIKTYSRIIKPWCLSDIGGLKLEKVNRYTAEEIGNKVKTSSRASSTKSKIIREIRKMFDYAVRQQYILKNPFNCIDRIRSGEQVNPHKAFTKDEASKILNEYKDEFVLYPFIVIALHTGMRSGEICGLTWDCIDFDNKTITVNKQLIQHTDKQLYLDPPKHNSKGTIRVDNTLLAFLKEYKTKVKRKNYSKDKSGKLIDGNSFAFVLVTKDGTPLINIDINKKANAGAKKGYTKFKPHDFRDTYATWLFMDRPNELKFIQKQLRHKKLSTTLDMYIRLIGESPKTENETLNAVFGSI